MWIRVVARTWPSHVLWWKENSLVCASRSKEQRAALLLHPLLMGASKTAPPAVSWRRFCWAALRQAGPTRMAT